MALFYNCVVVEFYHWFNLIFSSFWNMVVYDNEYKLKNEKYQIVPRIKSNHNIYIVYVDWFSSAYPALTGKNM